MQKRSLLKIFLYTILSLGVYELVWLYRTSQELTKLTAVRIPSIRWLVLLNALQLTGVILAIALTFMIIETNRSAPVPPSCWSEYVIATAPETSDKADLSSTCRSQVERSLAATEQGDKLIKGYLAVIVLLVISRLGYPRWLRNYTLAVQQVTKGKLSQAMAGLLLAFAPVLGVVMVQNVFNNIGAQSIGVSPAGQTEAYRPGKNKVAHKVLSVLAAVLAIAFGLLVLFLIAVSR